MNRPRRQVVVLMAWLVGVTAALAVLLAVGADRPGTPPLTRPSDWRSWAAGRETPDLVAAGARLIAIAGLGYLLLITTAQLALGLRGRRQDRPSRCLGRGAPRFVCALAAAAVASGSAAGASESASGTASPPDPSSHTAGAGGVVIQPGMGATMQLVAPDEETSLPWADDLAPAPAGDTTPAPAAAAPQARVAGEWVVRPGDHLWGIAEEVLTEHHGQDPTEAAIRDLWVGLIEVNRDRLVDLEDPDLILPGQRLVLPG